MIGPALNIDEVLTDKNLLGAALHDQETWATWRVILKAAFALPLDGSEREVFAEIAGGRPPPAKRVSELWVIAGRRGGKSRMAGALAAYAATFTDYRLAPGELGTVLALAVNQTQAKVALDYAGAFLEASPVLRQQLDGERIGEEIRLKGNIVIKAGVANFRSVRSTSLLLAIFDESAYWRDADSSTNPDSEIYSAVLPSLATSNGLLVGISSPYRRAGLLYRKHESAFGQDNPNVLVIKAPTRRLNPTLPEHVIERAREMDPEAARSEWDAEFRSDISDFVSRDAVMACVDKGVFERPFSREWAYRAFVDPSGGSSDSMTLAIGHREGTTAVLDAVREWKPPFNPEAVVAEACGLCRKYRIASATGDRYAGEWVASAFRAEGVNYEAADRTKSEIYIDLLPAVNSGAVALLDHERTISQLLALERRVGRGRDSVDHPPGGHDDVINAAAGALVTAATKRSRSYRDNDPNRHRPVPITDPLAMYDNYDPHRGL